MASKNKVINLIAAIKTMYPYYAKETKPELLFNMWFRLMNDVPDNLIDAALYKCLQTCKTPPTPADIIEQVKLLHQSTEPTEIELWDILADAIIKTERLVYRFKFTAVQSNGLTQGANARLEFDDMWNGLPKKIKQYLGGKNELIRLSKADMDDLKFEKARFLKMIPDIVKREEYKVITEKLIASGNKFLLD